MTHLRNPIPSNQWGAWIVHMEKRLEEMLKRSEAVEEALKALGDDDASNKVRTTFSQVVGRLVMTRRSYEEVKYADAVDLLGDRPADVLALDRTSEIRVAWRTAFATAVSAMPAAEAMTLHQQISQLTSNLCTLAGHFHNGVQCSASQFMMQLHIDLDAIREAIVESAESANVEFGSEDNERESWDAILFAEYADDIYGNADAIAALAARYIEENKRHEAQRAAERANNDDALIAICERCLTATTEYNAILSGDEAAGAAFAQATLIPLMVQIGSTPARTLEGHAAKARVFMADQIDCSGGPAQEAKDKFLADLANLAPASVGQSEPLKEAA